MWKQDSEAPTPPANVHVTSATASAVSVAWEPAADNMGVAGYYVYGDGSRKKVSSTASTLMGLECGQSTYVAVVAFDRARNQSASAPATVSTAACADTRPPTVPTGFVQQATTQDAVVLAWNPSSDDVGVVRYGVYQGLIQVASPSDPEVTLRGFICGSTAAYQVDAVDAAGNRSALGTAYVQTASCADSRPPTPPDNLVVTSRTSTSLALAWSESSDDVGVAGYRVSVAGGGTVTVTQPVATVAGLLCGSQYTVSVDAYDAAGNRSPGLSVSASTDACPEPAPVPPSPSGDTTAPSTPDGVAALSISQSSVTLGWNPSSDDVGVTGYDVYRGSTKVTTVPSTTATPGGLACGTAYSFGVAARDAAGNVSKQAAVTISTSACSPQSAPPPPEPTPPPPSDATAPSQPTNLAISSSTRTSATLIWSASTDAVGVRVTARMSTIAAADVALPGTTIAGLACGTAYTFAVDAADAAGNRSSRASIVGSTAACPDTQPPTAPTNVVASSRTATSIALTWPASTDNVGVGGYGLYRGGVAIGTTTTTTGIFAGLTCNTNYTLAVDAFDLAGNRSSKSAVMVSTTACPDTPHRRSRPVLSRRTSPRRASPSPGARRPTTSV